MGKTWILHTETKGTGANMVPLERAAKGPAEHEPLFVPRKPKPRLPEAPKPRPPHRFRVLDVMTRQLVADNVDAAAAIQTLSRVRSIVDINVFVWHEERERWRPLTFEEQRIMFEMASEVASGSPAERPA